MPRASMTCAICACDVIAVSPSRGIVYWTLASCPSSAEGRMQKAEGSDPLAESLPSAFAFYSLLWLPVPQPPPVVLGRVLAEPPVAVLPLQLHAPPAEGDLRERIDRP